MKYLSKLYFWDDRALYVGSDFITEMHSHHAIQIVIGLSRQICIRTNVDDEWQECEFAFIFSDTPHQLGQTQQQVALLYLDNETKDAIGLKESIFKKSPIHFLHKDMFLDVIPTLQKISEKRVDCDSAYIAFNLIINKVLGQSRPKKSLDQRIEKVIEKLKNTSEASVSVAELAESVGLSLGRLGHLFKEQTGFPIRRYFLWRKLINSIRALENASTLTEAAHQAGFSDSSHMNRTFKKMFGIKPSFFLHYSQFVQFINCSIL